MKRLVLVSVLTSGLLIAPFVQADEIHGCPLAGQKQMAMAQLFFGLAVPGRGPVNAKEWQRFTARTLSRYFPDGFTAYDGAGQWMDTNTHRIVRERSKVVVVVAGDDASFAKSIAAVTDAYRSAFRQQSVGVVTQTACAAF
jgi:hypothetical protein